MKPTTKFTLDTLKNYKKEITLITIISVIGSLMVTVTPYLYGRLFGLAIVPKTPVTLLLTLILLWLTLNVLSTFIQNRASFRGSILSIKVSLAVEADAYAHFLTLPVPFHKKERKGQILNKISRGAWNIQHAIDFFSGVLPQFLVLLFSVIVMFVLEWQLALIVLFSFAIYSLVTIRMTKNLIKIQDNENKEYEKQYGNVYDKLYNIFLVKNFSMEKAEREKFTNSLVDKLVPISEKTSRKDTKLSTIQGLIYSISFVLVLGTAIFFLQSGIISSSEFVMFFGYTNLAFSPFTYIASIYKTIKKSSTAVKRLVKLNKVAPEEMKHGNQTIDNVKGEITFKDVTFEYAHEKEVLKDINLKIKPGETIALVGRSGVGKTTFSELVMGYYQPKKGKIMLDGVDISKLKLSWLRDQIAIVPQSLELFNESLLDNLRYAKPDSTPDEVIEASKAALAHEFIMKFPKGYKSVIGDKGLKLSMGQRQRIAIAMAFLKNPKILILDEPTSALDAESEEKVQEGINELIRGRTTIIIAHRFSTVRKADRIVVLSEGKIAEIGTHDELIKKRGIYQKLYSLQTGID